MNLIYMHRRSTLKKKNYTRPMRSHYVDICGDILETNKTK